MYPSGKHPIYPYSEEDRQGVIKDSGLNEKRINEDVKIIEEWWYKQPHLAEAGIKKQMIELMLYMSKGSIEITKKKLDLYYRLRYYAPDIIQGRLKILNDPNANVFGSHLQSSMPKLFKGNRITFTKFTNLDDPNLTLNVILGVLMVTDIRYVNDFMSSDIWIVDMEGVSLKYVMRTDWNLVHKAARIIQEGTSLRVAGIHLINCSVGSIIQFLLNVLKQILSQKIYGRLKFHQSIEELHKEIPKEYLPKDYGGELPSTTEIRDKFEKLIKSDDTRKLLIDSCKLVSDESKRIKDEYSEEYLMGTFKQLNLD